MGRLIGDGIYYLIVDVVVKPEFQKEELEVKLLIYCWHMWMIELLMAAEPVYN